MFCQGDRILPEALVIHNRFMIVTYNVTIPSNLTEHQKELFRQLKDSSN